jgi:XTP/dITP diphosphohydrolase
MTAVAAALKHPVVYVTSSPFKVEENRVFQEVCTMPDGSRVVDHFEFQIRALEIKEVLEVDLNVMVQAEVVQAYSQIKVPCIVEHAGLIFEEYKGASYPGGLTKPMWNTLGDNFLAETKSAGRKAIARAVVAYCDGLGVRTFVGETSGHLAEKPRGGRHFYWDTIFIPETEGEAAGKTYAEIVETSSLGLAYKMQNLSQSGRAMINFLTYLLAEGRSPLWR